MTEWYKAGYLNDDLRVRVGVIGGFVSIEEQRASGIDGFYIIENFIS